MELQNTEYIFYILAIFFKIAEDLVPKTPHFVLHFFCQREVDLKYPDSQMCHQSFNGLPPLP